jgi:hypothetical protein
MSNKVISLFEKVSQNKKTVEQAFVSKGFVEKGNNVFEYTTNIGYMTIVWSKMNHVNVFFYHKNGGFTFKQDNTEVEWAMKLVGALNGERQEF